MVHDLLSRKTENAGTKTGFLQFITTPEAKHCTSTAIKMLKIIAAICYHTSLPVLLAFKNMLHRKSKC
jgi:hypothetical protein